VIRRLALAVGAAALLAVPATAAAAPKPAPEPKPEIPAATVKVEPTGLKGGKAMILDTVPVKGTVSPFVPGQFVEVTFYVNGKKVTTHHRVAVQQGPNETGTFESEVVVKEAGKYAVSAKHVATATLGGDSTVRKSWKVEFPKLNKGECSDVVEAFKVDMGKMGYVSGGGKCFNSRLGREVLAYRKVNGMDRTKKAGPGLVKSVFAGKGGYHVKYPDAGEHVEAPLALQVIALIKDGKAFAIYPISSGKPSTPTITGHYTFYREEPGYNSEGMYYSWYWHNGYAVHGYHEVPNYAASHGCLRTFIADQPRIFEQLHLGESIYVW
jgi:hypothetical protein